MPKAASDSALYRVAKNVGFNARVEPMWYTFHRLGERLSVLQKWKEKRRIRKLVAKINEKTGKPGWETKTGKCISNLRVAKIGLPAELIRWIGSQLDREVYEKWPHVLAQRETDALILPVDFERPFDVPAGSYTMVISSAPRLRAQLEEVNKTLNIEESFALAKMSKIDYVDAKERDISIYESRFATLDDFWPKFGYVLLKKLADKSVESGFPVHFA